MERKEYQPVRSDDEESTGLLLQPVSETHQRRHIWLGSAAALTIVVLLVSNLWLALKVSNLTSSIDHGYPRYSPVGIDRNRIAMFEGYGTPEYTDPNTREDAWESIEQGHGVVAIPRPWAAEHGLQQSAPFINDTSKDLYLIAAYHGLHCVVWLRRHMMMLLRGENFTKRMLGHTHHCFDVVREELMCTADDTLLVTNYTNSPAGHGQTRQCRDWRSIRDFATEFNAKYLVTDHLKNGLSAFDHDDHGTDGLILPHIDT